MVVSISECIPEFKSGELVVVRIIGRLYSEEGWAMGGWDKINEFDTLKIYEKIDLGNFPSSNDFFGESSFVADGDIAIIIRSLGRPYKLSLNNSASIYDIYEIMINGNKRQLFRNNIEKLSLPKKLNEDNCDRKSDAG